MPRHFSCKQGHQWDADATTQGQGTVCPICGGAARSRTPGSPSKSRASEAATRPPQPPQSTTDYIRPEEDSSKFVSRRGTPEGETLPLAKQTSNTPASPPSIPGHTILEVLGRGGMGVVYKARDLKRKRLVALKMILAAGHAGPAQVGRFRKEAQAIARLRHPNIVQLYESGESDGCPFFTIELVAAGSLAEQLDGTPWSARKAARLVRTLARAIHHAHQAGIIHRDLKPANVLLTEDGTPKITDFGLARQLDTSGCQTPSDAMLGTPSYMAPEQAGQAKHVGPAADVYSLGAILYELLTGQPPFKGDTPLDIVMQVVADNPVPPRVLRPNLSRDLETICLKCLEKDPSQRYATALALANDLRRFVADESVQAKRARPWNIAIQWVQNNLVISFMIGVLLLSIVISFLAVIWQQRSQDDIFKNPFEQLPAPTTRTPKK